MMLYPRVVLVLILLAAASACNRTLGPPSTTSKESTEPLKQYPMQGAVIRVDPDGRIATIKSGKIEGWMEAMTMDYPVKDAADFSKLHAGDTIQATVFVQGLNYWVGGVRVEDAGAGGASPAASSAAPPAAK